MAKRGAKMGAIRTLPLFMEDAPTTCVIPREPPNLEGVDLLAVDTETSDPNMEELGPGFIRKDAHILGASISTADADWYFPMKHVSGNCEWNVEEWLQDTFRDESKHYVFCNAHYDVEALWSIDAIPQGSWSDISLLQALIDEEFKGGYSLENISNHYLGVGKDSDSILKATEFLGCQDIKSAMQNLRYLSGGVVAPYAMTDTRRTYDVYQNQQGAIQSLDIADLVSLEERLLPVTWQMRLNGVQLDMDKAEQLRQRYMRHESALLKAFYQAEGQYIDVWSGKQITAYCARKGIEFPTTELGNASFKGDWLDTHADPGLRIIAEIRSYAKMRRDFIEMWLRCNVKGRIHSRWKQTMTEDGGTRTGRFASSDPNLTQVPVRDPIHGPQLRGLFIAEKKWGKFDYQAQEIRIGAHFGKATACKGVDVIIDKYKADRTFDFHQFVADMASIERTPAKTLGLGSMYGMSPKKTMSSLGMSRERAEWVYDEYHKAVPWVLELANLAMDRAEKRGFVRTFLGRYRRFSGGEMIYKALNAIIQGTAADMIKKAALDVYDELSLIPLAIVHDEADYDTDEEEAVEIARVMENALPLFVPMLVEPTLGDSWNV